MNDKIQFLNKIFYACPEKVEYTFLYTRDAMVYTFYNKKNVRETVMYTYDENENYFFYNTLTLSS